MKKYQSVFLSLCLMCMLVTGCSDKGTSETESNSPEIQESTKLSAESNDPKLQDSTAAGGVDVDLTVMSSTMVYAEVYNMMEVPDDYIGKTVKMRGPYYASYYDETDTYYHYVIIEDATSCCAQGLEFIWNGEHTYPDDYPEENAKIEVVGVFGSYEELGNTYYYLAVDDISF